jgi:DivIVA domain-containing protein
VTLPLILLAMLVTGLAAAVATGRITGGLAAPGPTLPSPGLPERPVTGADLDGVRFIPALRGYRMDQVDAVLDRLAAELRSRDEQLARLRDWSEMVIARTPELAAQHQPELAAQYHEVVKASMSPDPPGPTADGDPLLDLDLDLDAPRTAGPASESLPEVGGAPSDRLPPAAS